MTEGSGFNIFVENGVLYTPYRGVLQRVTRRSVIDTARVQGLEVCVETVPVDMAYSCVEIFMCMIAGGIMRITMLDGQPVQDGKLGPITKNIWDGYWAMHHDDEYSFEIQYDHAGQKVDNVAAGTTHEPIGNHVS